MAQAESEVAGLVSESSNRESANDGSARGGAVRTAATGADIGLAQAESANANTRNRRIVAPWHATRRRAKFRGGSGRTFDTLAGDAGWSALGVHRGRGGAGDAPPGGKWSVDGLARDRGATERQARRVRRRARRADHRTDDVGPE